MAGFKLNYEAYKNAKVAIETLKNSLDSHMVEMGVTNRNLSDNWHGHKAMSVIETMNIELTSGNYDKTSRYATGGYTILDDYHPTIDKLGAIREQIGQNLHSDEMIIVDSREHVEPDLIFNYDFMSALNAAADGAIENGTNMAQTIQEMIDKANEIAGDYLNLSKASTKVEKGKKKIKRIKNYKTAFNKLSSDMTKFETEISAEFEAKMKEIGDVVQEGTVYDRYEQSDRENISSIQESNYEPVISTANIEPESTGKDYKKLAEAYKSAFVIGNSQMLKSVIGQFLIVEFETNITRDGLQNWYNYKVRFDKDMITAVLSHLDGEEHEEMRKFLEEISQQEICFNQDEPLDEEVIIVNALNELFVLDMSMEYSEFNENIYINSSSI